MFNKNSVGNRATPIIYNGKTYPSGEDLRRKLKLSSGCVSSAIKLGFKIKGFYVDYAI